MCGSVQPGDISPCEQCPYKSEEERVFSALRSTSYGLDQTFVPSEQRTGAVAGVEIDLLEKAYPSEDLSRFIDEPSATSETTADTYVEASPKKLFLRMINFDPTDERMPTQLWDEFVDEGGCEGPVPGHRRFGIGKRIPLCGVEAFIQENNFGALAQRLLIQNKK